MSGLRRASPVVVVQVRPAHQQSLDDDVLELLPQLSYDLTVALLLSYELQGVDQSLLVGLLVLLELGRLLVDCIVRQMLEQTRVNWRLLSWL